MLQLADELRSVLAHEAVTITPHSRLAAILLEQDRTETSGT